MNARTTSEGLRSAVLIDQVPPSQLIIGPVVPIRTIVPSARMIRGAGCPALTHWTSPLPASAIRMAAVANRPGSSANASQARCRICGGSWPATRPRVIEVLSRMATIPARGPCPDTSQITAAARPSVSGIRSQKSPARTPSAGRSTPAMVTPSGAAPVRAANSRRIASTTGPSCSRASRAALASSISWTSARRRASASAPRSRSSGGPTGTITASWCPAVAASRNCSRSAAIGLRTCRRTAT